MGRAFDWKEYLELAKSLENFQGNGFSQEAAERSGVSRAYYALFCTLREYAARHMHFLPTGRPEDHRRLREHLLQNRHRNWAQDLDRLRQWRNACDYENVIEPDQRQQMFRASIRLAEKIFEQLP